MIPNALDNFPPNQKPTLAEQKLIDHINQKWDRAHALYELKIGLQTAIEIELATIPLYLYTYYSINRTPQTAFPYTEVSRFADQAGAIIMSVAVEEMLHMSLASNILYSLGQQPHLYLRSPSPFPTNLPGHSRLGPDSKPMSLSLSKFSFKQLWSFLEIEYPAGADVPPEGKNWQTIGQIYSYLRCIIFSKHISNEDFQKGSESYQIRPNNYSPSNIDTVYPHKSFNHLSPIPASQTGSAAQVASYANYDDQRKMPNNKALMTINSKSTALEAIATIDYEGEGFSPSRRYDDPLHLEQSHYYKFLKLQSQLKGYNHNYEHLAPLPKPPDPVNLQFGTDELRTFTYNFPDNPVAANYPDGWCQVANVVSGLYQYMLIMTETTFLLANKQQISYFNKSMHYSMIWILDKIIQAMRETLLPPNSGCEPSNMVLAPTFENIDLGSRNHAFSNLVTMCNALNQQFGTENWYTNDLQYYVNMIPNLPDVSAFWPGSIPKFPATPPSDDQLQPNEVRHACMGLNSCQGQGRTRNNACAGQGYCSTALAYNYSNPSEPLVQDHQCRVLNNCAGQGGCGLYGTAEQQDKPGANNCATNGSCATPINAERFSTDGPNRGKSVWKHARDHFEKYIWPQLHENNPALPTEPPKPQPQELFKYGPTIEWIENYSGQGMTACGSSGMSGAGSCA